MSRSSDDTGGVEQALLKVLPQGPRAFRLVGELDVSSVDPLAELLEAEVEGNGDVTLDLSELRFLDSAGIHVLIRTASALEGRGGLRLVEPGSSVARVIETTDLERLANLEVVGGEDGRWPGYGSSLPDAPGDPPEDPSVPSAPGD